MFAVIFKVQPKKERFDDYLALAKQLKPKLEAIDGFIDNDRFKSQRNPDLLLSLSTWRDEKAVIRWRTHGEHHGVQEKGRFEVFQDYHLRVGEIVADSTPPAGLAVAQQRFDETTVGTGKAVTISELAPTADKKAASADVARDLGLAKIGTEGVVDHQTFESIYTPGKLLLLVSWRDAAAAERWVPTKPAQGKLRHRRVRIIRDYGMSDRREAPQYYPDVAANRR
jgi:heme-degrading monooxygenase HmoA